MQIDTDMIQKKVDECINSRKAVYPLPITQIAAEYGFAVKYFTPNNDPDLIKISGAIKYDDKVIWVNSDEIPERQKFTIAHELGHALLHPGDNIIDYRMNNNHSQKEAEANEFAARILMPENEINKIRKQITSVAELAKYFGVSMQAMLLRLKKLQKG